MKEQYYILLIMLLMHISALAQKGYPERGEIKELFEKFQMPPAGYGEFTIY